MTEQVPDGHVIQPLEVSEEQRAAIPRPGVAVTTVTQASVTALLASWVGFDAKIVMQVLTVLNDLGIIAGLTSSQIQATVAAQSGPSRVSRGQSSLP